jgi:hypothetical protein
MVAGPVSKNWWSFGERKNDGLLIDLKFNTGE